MRFIDCVIGTDKYGKRQMFSIVLRYHLHNSLDGVTVAVLPRLIRLREMVALFSPSKPPGRVMLCRCY